MGHSLPWHGIVRGPCGSSESSVLEDAGETWRYALLEAHATTTMGSGGWRECRLKVMSAIASSSVSFNWSFIFFLSIPYTRLICYSRCLLLISVIFRQWRNHGSMEKGRWNRGSGKRGSGNRGTRMQGWMSTHSFLMLSRFQSPP